MTQVKDHAKQLGYKDAWLYVIPDFEKVII